MAKAGILLLTVVSAVWVSFAGEGRPGEDKEALVQGKPLSYWLKELKDPDPLAREEAIVVLARAGEAARSATPVLLELLKDKSAPVRVRAAALLGQLKSHTKEAAPVLLEAYKDGSRTLRHQILPALGPLALENEKVLLLLLRASSDTENQTRFLASLAINKSRPAVFAPLAKALDHADPVVRRQSVIHLNSAGKEFVPSLSRMLKDDDWDTRFWAAHALWRLEKNPRAVLGVMVEASAKDDPVQRRAAWEVVLQMKPPAKEALAVYKAALKEGPPATKVQAANAVWHITRKADDVLPVYREVLTNAPQAGYPTVTQAVAALKQMGPEAKALRVPLLEMLKQSKDYYVIQSVGPILAGLGPESIPGLVEVAGGLVDQGNQLEQTRARVASYALGQMGKPGIKPLVVLMEHAVLMVRLHAYGSVHLAGPDAKDAVPALRKALKHASSNDRAYAVMTLSRLGLDAREALPDLLEVARKEKEPTTRRYALAALPHLRPPVEDVLKLLEDSLDDRFPLLRLTAADWLWHLDPKDPRPVKIVASTLHDGSCIAHGLKMLVHHRDAAKPAIPALTELLNNKEAMYRSLAIQTFDQLGIGTKEHQQKLVAALGDPDVGVRIAAAQALRKLGVEEKAAVDSLAKALPMALPFHNQMSVLAALAEFGPAAKDAIPAIERQMPSAITLNRVIWIETLAAIDTAMVPKWRFTLEETFTKYGSIPAARLLGQHDPKETKYVDFVVEKLQDSSVSNRLTAAMTLAKGGAWARQTVPALCQALEDSDPRVRIQVALALEKLEPKKHKIVPVLIEGLRDKEDHNARLQAANALAALGPAAVDAVPALRAAVRDSDSYVRFAANEALWNIDPTSTMPCVFQGY